MSAEYGWTDEQIGEIPLSRFRQITSTIQTRRTEQRDWESGLLSWQTRILAGFIANGYLTDGKEENKALDQARTLGFTELDRILAGGAAKGGRPEHDRHPSSGAEAEQWAAERNKGGSYERLMGLNLGSR